MTRAARSTVVVALGGACVALAALASGTARASTYDRGRSGSMVLYALMQDLGFRPLRVFDVDALGAVGARLAFDLGWSDGPRLAELVRWVERGGRLVLAPPLIGDAYCDGLHSGQLQLERKAQLEGQVLRAAADPRLKLRRSACHLVPRRGDKVLVGSEKLALALERRIGDGRLLLLAHDDLLTNRDINRDDLIVVVRRWVEGTTQPPAVVAFVEAKRAGQLLEMLRRAHLVPLALHSLALLLLIYWIAAPRFGELGGVPPQRRRAFAEHARALGHLLLGGGSSGHALRQQYERFVGHLLGAAEARGARPARRRAIAGLIATRTGREVDEVDRLLAEIELASDARTRDPRELQRHFRLSQALADLQRKSGMRRTGGRRGRTTVR